MYGLIGKLTAKSGKRDELIEVLLDGVTGMPGCLSYVVASHQRRIPASVGSVSDSLDAAFRRGQRTVVVSDTALGLAYITPTTAVTLGALEGLLASGRLGIVEDRELRGALGSWGSELAELTEEEIDSRALAFGDFDRTLRARVNTHGLWATANRLFDSEPEALEPQPTRTPLAGDFLRQ